MQYSVRHTLALFAAIALAAACGDDNTSPNENDAELTVVHATASLGAVDVTVGDETAVTNLAYGSASGRVGVPSGTQRIVVRSGATVIGDFEATLSTEHVNAVVIAGGTASVSSTVIPDTGTVAPVRANLRLVNVVGTATGEPYLLDLLINAPSVSPDSTARIGGIDTRVARYSSLMYFDAGHFRLRYVPAGTNTVLAEAEFDIAQGEVKVAVLERNANGTYKVTIVEETGG